MLKMRPKLKGWPAARPRSNAALGMAKDRKRTLQDGAGGVLMMALPFPAQTNTKLEEASQELKR
jgi:hypothetical protein